MKTAVCRLIGIPLSEVYLWIKSTVRVVGNYPEESPLDSHSSLAEPRIAGLKPIRFSPPVISIPFLLTAK